MSILFQQLWLGIILPVVVSAAVLLVGWKPWKQDSEKIEPVWSIALALPAAYIAVHIGISDVSSFFPSNDMHWLVHVALLTAVAGVVESIWWERPIVRWVLRAGVLAGAVRLVAGFMFENTWSTGEGAAYMAVIVLLGALLIATLERIGERHPGATLPIAFVFLGTAVAVVLVQAGTAKVAQITGGLTAATGVTLLLAWWKNDANFARGGATVFGIMLTALATYGYFALPEVPEVSEWSQNPPLLALIAILLVPHLLWLLELDVFERLKGWKGTTARALLLAVGLGAAGSLTVLVEPPPEPEENKLEGVDYDSLY